MLYETLGGYFTHNPFKSLRITDIHDLIAQTSPQWKERRNGADIWVPVGKWTKCAAHAVSESQKNITFFHFRCCPSVQMYHKAGSEMKLWSLFVDFTSLKDVTSNLRP